MCLKYNFTEYTLLQMRIYYGVMIYTEYLFNIY